MIENPIIAQKEFNNDFHVVYVMKEIDDSIDTNTHKFCIIENIEFSSRPFSSFFYIEDSENIRRLPAIHLYYKDSYLDTYYPIEDPVSSIKSEIKNIKHKEELQKLKGRTKWWKRLFMK